MIIVYDFDEWFDFASPRLTGFRHPAGDMGWGAFKTGDQSMWKRMGLRARVERLDNHNLAESNISKGNSGYQPYIGICL
jgi:hypothetical protein